MSLAGPIVRIGATQPLIGLRFRNGSTVSRGSAVSEMNTTS